MNGHSDMKDNGSISEISLSPPNVLFKMYTTFVSVLKLMCIQLTFFCFEELELKLFFLN